MQQLWEYHLSLAWARAGLKYFGYCLSILQSQLYVSLDYNGIIIMSVSTAWQSQLYASLDYKGITKNFYSMIRISISTACQPRLQRYFWYCLTILQSQLYVSLDYKDNTKDQYQVCLNYMSVSTACQSQLYVSLDYKGITKEFLKLHISLDYIDTELLSCLSQLYVSLNCMSA